MMIEHTDCSKKEDQRNKIKADIERYLSSGGRITVIETGWMEATDVRFNPAFSNAST